MMLEATAGQAAAAVNSAADTDVNELRRAIIGYLVRRSLATSAAGGLR